MTTDPDEILATRPPSSTTIPVDARAWRETLAEVRRLRAEVASLREECGEPEWNRERREEAQSMSMTIQELIRRSHETAVTKGWYDDCPGALTPPMVAEKLCLVHAEVSEALEEVRNCADLGHVYTGAKGKPEGFLVEVADVLIRLADLVGKAGLGEDLEAAIVAKMAYNATRPHRHGGKNL